MADRTDTPLENGLFDDENGGQAEETYLPEYPNYYLHRAAKLGFWLFWISVATIVLGIAQQYYAVRRVLTDFAHDSGPNYDQFWSQVFVPLDWL